MHSVRGASGSDHTPPSSFHTLSFMADHPLHELFTLVNASVIAADGTPLQREKCCHYCANTWSLSKYPTGKRQGRWRVVDLEKLRKHLLQECNHNSDDILSVARAASKDEAHEIVVRIRAQHRRWPPPLATVERDPLAASNQVAAAAGQSLTPQRLRALHSTSMPQPDQSVDPSADDVGVSPSKRRRITSDAMMYNKQPLHHTARSHMGACH